MIRRPPRSTQSRSSAASDVYKRQVVEPHRARVLLDLPAIELGATIVADEDRRHARLDAAGGELLDFGDDLAADLLGDRLAVDDLCCHDCPSVYFPNWFQILSSVACRTAARSAAVSARIVSTSA